MKLRALIRVLFVVLLNWASSYGQSKFEIGPLQSCSSVQNTRWQVLETEFEGVHVQDPDTPAVAHYSAGRFGYFGIYLFPYNWLPLSDSKQIMCGRFARFDWNVVPPGENDWNLRIIPSQLFYDAYSDALPYSSDNKQVWNCDPTPNDDPARHRCGVNAGTEYGGIEHNCFEAELTPRSDRYQTPWFQKNDQNNACSNIVDYSVCAYGPYVTESVHGNRPEIHPAEALWWRNIQGVDWKSTEAQSWTFLHVQDASHRFDELSDFAPKPSDDLIDWAPWSAPKQAIEFDVSLETAAAPASPINFKMNELIADGVVPIEADSAPRDVVVSFGGRPLYTISQLQHDTNHYQITRVSGVCTTPEGNVRSTVRMRSTVGVAKRGGRTADLGFHAIQLWNAQASDPTPGPHDRELLAFTPTSSQRTQLNPNTVDARIENGKLRVTARIEPSRKFSLLEQPAHEAEGQEVDVQSLLGPDVKVGLFTKVLEIHATPTVSSSASSLLAGFLGLQSIAGGIAKRLSDVVFTAAPQLTIIRHGQPAWEDSDELFSTFNQRLASAGRTGQKLLLNSPSDLTGWKLEAWKCGEHPNRGCVSKTGTLPIVYVKPPSGTPVVFVQADFEGDVPRFHVQFPSGTLADTLVWLRATGPTPSDGSAPQVLDFFNVAVPVADDSDGETERVVSALATFVGVSPSKLAGGSPGPSPDPFVENSRFRLAQMLRMQIKHASEESAIEPQAMALFLEQAKRLANLQ